jgi:NifU-like protein
MSFKKLTAPFFWERYPLKLKERIIAPKNGGFFVKENALEQRQRLIEGESRDEEGENQLRFYLLVEEDSGVITDARFSLLGHSALIGIADLACDLMIGMHIAQLSRISADLLEKQLDKKKQELPFEMSSYFNLALIAIDDAASYLGEFPEEKGYIAPPESMRALAEEGGAGYPGFTLLTEEKKLLVIEKVLEEDIRPFIALDGGGVEVESLTENYELILSYQGNCTTCFSAIGATLSYIQQVLKNKVYEGIRVTPSNLDF